MGNSELCGDLNGKKIQGSGDIYVFMQLIHFAMQQKLMQHCKSSYTLIFLNVEKEALSTLQIQ